MQSATGNSDNLKWYYEVPQNGPWYAVAVGRVIGIWNDWQSASESIMNLPRNERKHARFATREEAREWLNKTLEEEDKAKGYHKAATQVANATTGDNSHEVTGSSASDQARSEQITNNTLPKENLPVVRDVPDTDKNEHSSTREAQPVREGKENTVISEDGTTSSGDNNKVQIYPVREKELRKEVLKKGLLAAIYRQQDQTETKNVVQLTEPDEGTKDQEKQDSLNPTTPLHNKEPKRVEANENTKTHQDTKGPKANSKKSYDRRTNTPKTVRHAKGTSEVPKASEQIVIPAVPKYHKATTQTTDNASDKTLHTNVDDDKKAPAIDLGQSGIASANSTDSAQMQCLGANATDVHTELERDKQNTEHDANSKMSNKEHSMCETEQDNAPGETENLLQASDDTTILGNDTSPNNIGSSVCVNASHEKDLDVTANTDSTLDHGNSQSAEETPSILPPSAPAKVKGKKSKKKAKSASKKINTSQSEDVQLPDSSKDARTEQLSNKEEALAKMICPVEPQVEEAVGTAPYKSLLFEKEMDNLVFAWMEDISRERRTAALFERAKQFEDRRNTIEGEMKSRKPGELVNSSQKRVKPSYQERGDIRDKVERDVVHILHHEPYKEEDRSLEERCALKREEIRTRRLNALVQKEQEAKNEKKKSKSKPKAKSKKFKYYAVVKGRRDGVFKDALEASQSASKIPNSIIKGFLTEEEAQQWYATEIAKMEENAKDALITAPPEGEESVINKDDKSVQNDDEDGKIYYWAVCSAKYEPLAILKLGSEIPSALLDKLNGTLLRKYKGYQEAVTWLNTLEPRPAEDVESIISTNPFDHAITLENHLIFPLADDISFKHGSIGIESCFSSCEGNIHEPNLPNHWCLLLQCLSMETFEQGPYLYRTFTDTEGAFVTVFWQAGSRTAKSLKNLDRHCTIALLYCRPNYIINGARIVYITDYDLPFVTLIGASISRIGNLMFLLRNDTAVLCGNNCMRIASTEFECDGCEAIFFCSKECALKKSKSHEQECDSFKLCRELMDKEWFADTQPGSIIFEDAYHLYGGLEFEIEEEKSVLLSQFRDWLLKSARKATEDRIRDNARKLELIVAGKDVADLD